MKRVKVMLCPVRNRSLFNFGTCIKFLFLELFIIIQSASARQSPKISFIGQRYSLLYKTSGNGWAYKMRNSFNQQLSVASNPFIRSLSTRRHNSRPLWLSCLWNGWLWELWWVMALVMYLITDVLGLSIHDYETIGKGWLRRLTWCNWDVSKCTID